MNIAANCNELQTKVNQYEEGSPERIEAIKLANAEWSRLSEYTEPKLKAVELSGVVGLEEVSQEEFLDGLDEPGTLTEED